jgi:cytochrome c-type biogenesis protein CcmE
MACKLDHGFIPKYPLCNGVLGWQLWYVSRPAVFLFGWKMNNKFVKFGVPIVLIVTGLAYLAFSGIQESKSYYVTIKEMHEMGDGAYTKRLRVAGNVQPGSIRRQGTHVEFVLAESGRTLNVAYSGTEAPPDTFKDNANALAEGSYGRDGVFHAKQLQAKCASKYAPAQPGTGDGSASPTSPPEKAQAAAPSSM